MSDESTLKQDARDLMDFFKARDWSPARAAETMAFCLYVLARARLPHPKTGEPMPSPDECRALGAQLIRVLAELAPGGGHLRGDPDRGGEVVSVEVELREMVRLAVKLLSNGQHPTTVLQSLAECAYTAGARRLPAEPEPYDGFYKDASELIRSMVFNNSATLAEYPEIIVIAAALEKGRR